MDWANVVKQIFELVVFPLLGIGTTYLIVLINAKIKELKKQSDSDLEKKYLDMLNNTIVDCVLATNQTYVNELKKQGKFDLDAQKIAFQKTYENVMALLTDEAKKYLSKALGDLQTYVNNKIEAEVLLNK
nr:MAG TPA: hypothetical protein [Caudoviricetes sp.]